MSQFVPVLTKSLVAAGAITAQRFVTAAGAQVASDGGVAVGVSRQAAETGRLFAVDMLGTAIVETGGSINLGVAVKSGADGRALTHNTGTKVGVALQAATGAGQRIEVLLLPSA